MIDDEKYFDYLYHALESNKLVPDSNLWRVNLEYAVSYLEIDKDYIERLKKEYSAQFSEVVLINATKNILVCRSMNTPISKELCAASVYFSLLGCLLDFWLDSGNDELRIKGITKLSWKNCKAFFYDFHDEKNIEDIADELFMLVGKGMQLISENNPDLYAYLLRIIKRAAASEVAVTENDQNVEVDLIYDKSVLFIEISLLIAIGNKTDLKEKDYRLFEQIGLLYAYIDDMMDIYEDNDNNQGNIFVKRLCAGESYQEMIDSSVRYLITLFDEIRKSLGDCMTDYLMNEISDWVFTNRNLTRRIYESEG